MLCSRVLRNQHEHRKQNFILRVFEAMFEAWRNGYEWSLDRVLRYKSVPLLVTMATMGVTVRLYSGASGPDRSSTRNHVPVTLAEITMEPGAVFEHDVQTSYNGFVYLVSGAARVGEDRGPLRPSPVRARARPGRMGGIAASRASV